MHYHAYDYKVAQKLKLNFFKVTKINGIISFKILQNIFSVLKNIHVWVRRHMENAWGLYMA